MLRLDVVDAEALDGVAQRLDPFAEEVGAQAAMERNDAGGFVDWQVGTEPRWRWGSPLEKADRAHHVLMKPQTGVNVKSPQLACPGPGPTAMCSRTASVPSSCSSTRLWVNPVPWSPVRPPTAPNPRSSSFSPTCWKSVSSSSGMSSARQRVYFGGNAIVVTWRDPNASTRTASPHNASSTRPTIESAPTSEA